MKRIRRPSESVGKVIENVMLCAIYEELGEPVCLGIRIGPYSEMERFKRLLIRQIRDRYPRMFVGLQPRRIAQVVEFHLYSTEPTAHGFPKYLGDI